MTFYQTIAANYDRIFPLNKAQVQFVHSRIPHRSTLLDMGCATGWLAVALAELGHKVAGIDLSPALLKIAAARIKAHRSRASVFELDMMNLAARCVAGQFNAITCFGNTLSHLPESQLSSLFSQVKSSLAEGGVFLMQIVNYDRLVSLGLSTLPTIENEHIRFERVYQQFNGVSPFTFHTQLTVHATGEILFADETLYPIRRDNLVQHLVSAGFRDIECFGSFKDAPVSNEAMPLIAVAKK